MPEPRPGPASRAIGLRRRVRSAGRRLAARFLRPQQVHRASQFALLGVPPRRVVFLGDSIT